MTKSERCTPFLEPVDIDDTQTALFHAGTITRTLMTAQQAAGESVSETGRIIPSRISEEDKERIAAETAALSQYGIALLTDGNMAAIPVLIASGELSRNSTEIQAKIDAIKGQPTQSKKEWEVLEQIATQILTRGGEILLPSENPEHTPVLARFSPAQDFGMEIHDIPCAPTVSFQDEPELTSFATRIHATHSPLEAVVATLWLDHGELLTYARGITQTSQESGQS